VFCGIVHPEMMALSTFTNTPASFSCRKESEHQRRFQALHGQPRIWGTRTDTGQNISGRVGTSHLFHLVRAMSKLYHTHYRGEVFEQPDKSRYYVLSRGDDLRLLHRLNRLKGVLKIRVALFEI